MQRVEKCIMKNFHTKQTFICYNFKQVITASFGTKDTNCYSITLTSSNSVANHYIFKAQLQWTIKETKLWLETVCIETRL